MGLNCFIVSVVKHLSIQGAYVVIAEHVKAIVNNKVLENDKNVICLSYVFANFHE